MNCKIIKSLVIYGIYETKFIKYYCMDGHGLINTACWECLPKKTKVTWH